MHDSIIGRISVFYKGCYTLVPLLAGVGARRPIVEEPLAWSEEYPIQWREPRLNLAELAKLRWIEELSTQELAKHFGKTLYAVENYYQAARRVKFEIEGLTAKERKQILWASKK